MSPVEKLGPGCWGDDAVVVAKQTDQSGATYVGMFDYVRCRYPLPHHLDALLHTKNLLSRVDPGE